MATKGGDKASSGTASGCARAAGASTVETGPGRPEVQDPPGVRPGIRRAGAGTLPSSGRRPQPLGFLHPFLGPTLGWDPPVGTARAGLHQGPRPRPPGGETQACSPSWGARLEAERTQTEIGARRPRPWRLRAAPAVAGHLQAVREEGGTCPAGAKAVPSVTLRGCGSPGSQWPRGLVRWTRRGRLLASPGASQPVTPSPRPSRGHQGSAFRPSRPCLCVQ